jgi:hypothetical protein
MIDMFFKCPFWVTVLIGIVCLIGVGFYSIDKDGKLDLDRTAPGILAFICIISFWQLILVLAAVCAVMLIPFYFGVTIKKMIDANKKGKDDTFPSQKKAINNSKI